MYISLVLKRVPLLEQKAIYIFLVSKRVAERKGTQVIFPSFR